MRIKSRLLFCILLVTATVGAVAGEFVWKQFEGKRYVSVESLKQAGVEVKSLPGEQKLAVCTSDKCILISDFVRDDGNVWLSREMLEAAGAKFTEENGKPQMKLDGDGKRETGTRVGTFAPSLRFTLLDGRAVELSNFAGRRVLINSWASW